MNNAQLETLSRSALEIVTHDRNEQYGEPENSFAVIAALWTGYLSAKWFKGNMGEIDAADVARMMELMKMARRMTAKVPKADSYIDAIGYVLCEAKMAETE